MFFRARTARIGPESGGRAATALALAGVLAILLLSPVSQVAAAPAPTPGSVLPHAPGAAVGSPPGVRPPAVPAPRSAPAPASEPPIWVNRTTAAGPSPREGSVMAFDPVLGKVVLFGGWNGTDAYADTWTYLDGVWTELPLSNHPSPRWGAGMAWDPYDQELVLFGGWNWTGAFNDTWVFKGTSWFQIHPKLTPAARFTMGFAWDPPDGYVVMYGGINHTWYNDTWTFLHGNWTPQHPSVSPPARDGPGMTYDAHDGYLVMSEGEGPIEYADVWSYAAGEWTNLTTAAGGTPAMPHHRDGMVMVYDNATNTTILALGESLGAYVNTTWSWSGGHYTQLFPSVAPWDAQYAAGAWDAADNYLLIFGGANGSRTFAQTFDWGPPLPLALEADSVSATSTSAETSVFYSTWAQGGEPPYSFAWQFGDGQTVGGARVTHSYAWPGTYQVNLTATDSTSSTARATFLITVVWGSGTPIVVTGAGTPLSGVAPLEVAFSGSAQGGFPGYTALWKFGDGDQGAGWNQSHTYATPGAYAANLSVTDRAGNVGYWSATVDVFATPPPLQALGIVGAATPRSGTSPLTVTFSGFATGGKPGYDYTWAFGDGDSAHVTNLTHTYATGGSFIATLTVEDAADHTVSISFTINVTASAGPSPTGLFGLPGNEGYALLVGLVAVVAVVGVVIVWTMRRRPPTGALGVEGAPLDAAYDPSTPSMGGSEPPPGMA